MTNNFHDYVDCLNLTKTCNITHMEVHIWGALYNWTEHAFNYKHVYTLFSFHLLVLCYSCYCIVAEFLCQSFFQSL